MHRLANDRISKISRSCGRNAWRLSAAREPDAARPWEAGGSGAKWGHPRARESSRGGCVCMSKWEVNTDCAHLPTARGADPGGSLSSSACLPLTQIPCPIHCAGQFTLWYNQFCSKTQENGQKISYLEYFSYQSLFPKALVSVKALSLL